MSEQDNIASEQAGPAKMKVVFRARNWTIKSRVNRSGREAGEMIVMTGHIFVPSIDANTPLSRARAEVKQKDAQDRMSVRIGKEETSILMPLEEFAMERITAKIKEMSGQFGLTVGLEFEANETTDNQLVEFADFTFTNSAPATAVKPAAKTSPAVAQAPAAAPQQGHR